MPLETSIKLQDASEVSELFARAAQANISTAGRSGCAVDLPDKGRLTLTGDLHDHLDNFEAILKLARINYSPNYHVVFQEVIHGEHRVGGNDLSYRMLARIAQLKIEKPDQVHHILSNHEMAQITGEGVLKDGVSVVDAFDRGLDYVFGEQSEQVRAAIRQYIQTMPLAVRCANGVLCAHSLPSAYHREHFDSSLLTRSLTDDDLHGPDGHAYVMVWGRGLAQTVADELSTAWGVRQFVLGHQHVDMGWETAGQNMLILNSDHAHGVALPIDLSTTYDQDALCEEITPLNAVL